MKRIRIGNDSIELKMFLGVFYEKVIKFKRLILLLLL